MWCAREMNLRHIEVFHAVMSAGSVTEAARRLNVTQPAVSTMLKHAESNLGVKLFERFGGRLVPTPDAEALFPTATGIFAGVENFQRSAQDVREGRKGFVGVVTSNLLSHLVVPAALRHFQKLYPHSRVYVDATTSSNMEALVNRRAFELAIGYVRLRQDTINVELLGSMSIRCVLQRSHPLASRAVLTLEDIQDEPLIVHRSTTSVGELVRQNISAAGLAPNVVLETNAHMASWCMVREGLGIALTLPLEDVGAFTDLVAIPFMPTIRLDIALLFARDRPKSRLATAFADAVRTAVQESNLFDPPGPDRNHVASQTPT